jgi:hypothetical protein
VNIKINKCWNSIRFIVENDYFSSSFLPIIEESIAPMIQLLEHPGDIDFDDDILYCISSLTKKSKQITSTQISTFKYFPLLHKKYKFVFGTLLTTLNYYIVYGKEYFE